MDDETKQKLLNDALCSVSEHLTKEFNNCFKSISVDELDKNAN